MRPKQDSRSFSSNTARHRAPYLQTMPSHRRGGWRLPSAATIAISVMLGVMAGLTVLYWLGVKP